MNDLTLADYRSFVRALLVDSDYDLVLIDQAINWVVSELCTNNHLRIMEASATLTAGQGDTTLGMPDDFMTMIKDGFYVTSPRVEEIGRLKVTYREFMRSYANFATASQSRASVWTDFANQVRFSNPLDADHTFQLDYLRKPVLMESPTDECEIPDIHSELVSKLSLARIMEVNEDYAEAQQERSNAETLRATFIVRESRGGFSTGPTKIGQARRGPWRADRDF